MKISNSKKQLAKIIHENGGWPRDAEYSSQDGSDGQVSFYKSGSPIYNKLSKIWNAPGSCVHMYGSRIEGLGRAGVIKNFHQTILSLDEYFRLYQEQGLEAALDEPLDSEESKPTIEQLATDYHNLLDLARRKQEEADKAKADAEAKLAELISAGNAHGLVLSVAGPEPELVITDWRDLLPGDEVEYVEGSQGWYIGMVGVVQRTDHDDGGNMNVRLLFGDKGSGCPRKWRFIRRP